MTAIQRHLILVTAVLILASAGNAQKAPSGSPETLPAPTVLFDTSDNPHQTEKANATIPEQIPAITDIERSSLTFTAYDLDVHLVPAKSQLAVRAVFKICNSGTKPLTRLIFQISSSLHWEGFAVRNAERLQPLSFTQHLLDTDTDHTGQATEAVVSLAQPLASGESADVTALYSGEITQSSKRLERIGAPAGEASQSDWDKIDSTETALRGFGNVLWYPSSAAPALLGDRAKLFQSVGQTKLQQSAATIHLRLTVEYVGEPPKAAYFCGRREQLLAVSENANALVADSPGVAIAEFSTRPLGFRTPSLFVTEMAPVTAGDDLVSVLTNHEEALASYAAAISEIKPLLTDWLGPTPLTNLTVLDHEGQPFEDGAMLVTSMRPADPSDLTPVLVHSLTHAWFNSSHVWLSEGVAQFLSLLWTEQSKGRDTALQQLHHDVNVLSLAEPDLSKGDEPAQFGQSLIRARDEVYYRNKAAAVLWMLRSIVGDEPLKQAVQIYRRSGKREEDPNEFQRVLEQTTKKDLRWFFDDWVYRDRGLPDLSIASVTPRELPAQGGKPGGWLVAVEVRNEGAAVADVPVTVRSGTLTATARVRVAGRSNASTRILFEGIPEEIVVNDGNVPEVGVAIHTRQLVAR